MLIVQVTIFMLNVIYIHSNGPVKRGIEFIPERAEITEMNPKYVNDVKVFVLRYSRKSKYVVNLNFTNLHSWHNNVSVSIFVYEFLHNEYRRSFVDMHFSLCDMFKNVLLGPTLIKAGLTCPLEKGTHRLYNLSIISDNFPYVWPFQKGKGEMIVKQKATGEVIAAGYLCLTFKQINVKKQ